MADFGQELKGLPQPPKKGNKPSGYRRAAGVKRKMGRSAFARSKTGKLGGARSSSGLFRKSKKSWLMKKLITLVKRAVRPKGIGDFRNHGFKKSGKGGRTGFAGMK